MCSATAGFCGVGDRTQGFPHAGRASPPSFVPSPFNNPTSVEPNREPVRATGPRLLRGLHNSLATTDHVPNRLAPRPAPRHPRCRSRARPRLWRAGLSVSIKGPGRALTSPCVAASRRGACEVIARGRAGSDGLNETKTEPEPGARSVDAGSPRAGEAAGGPGRRPRSGAHGGRGRGGGRPSWALRRRAGAGPGVGKGGAVTRRAAWAGGARSVVPGAGRGPEVGAT